MDLNNLVLDVEQHVEIKATPETVFEGLLRRLSDRNTDPSNEPMPMLLERWPGGRWFRDLGEGTGHLWGFVQVIKPPRLLEIHGPLFMSYPAAGHIAFRVEPTANGSRLSLRHRALGLIDEEHRKSLSVGWDHHLNSVKNECE